MRKLILGAALLSAAGVLAAAVPQGAPNSPDQKPAFAGQTRAPEAKSNVAFEVETVASGLAKPWGVDFLADGRMLVTEKTGALRLVGKDGKVSAPVPGVPEVDARDQGGLLDVGVKGGTVCLTYAEPRGEGKNGTAAYCATPSTRGAFSMAGGRVIFRQQPAWASTKHYGSRIVFAPDGNVFITTGERSNPEPRQYAQNLDATLGKVVRVTMSGQPAPGNPWLKAGGPRAQIWSYGHRNLQSAALDASGRLWTVEHGPKGGDELNRPQAGKNYGWPVITYGEDYSGAPIGQGITAKAGMEQPVYYWDPVIGPSGMVFYSGSAFPAWKGSAFVGGLVTKGLVRLAIRGDRVVGEERIDLGARIRDVVQGPDGFLYALTDETNGRLLRLRPKK
jgi:glucose/arabinose dehydrogenase